ncbi:MAG: hypothetical protein U0X76_09740 [Bacteroidia bacterium]
MRQFFILIFLLLTLPTLSQNRGNIWCFGDSAGIDFNQSPPAPIRSVCHGRGSCVSICDTNGGLLFYAATFSAVGNTTKVLDVNNSILPNGDSIVGQAWFHELSIASNPLNNGTYYLFSIGVTTSGSTGFYYSIVDMNLNGGLGQVVQKNIQLQPFQIDDELSTIKHGNGKDWWVFFRKSSAPNDTIYSYLVNELGISNLIVQKIGSINNAYFKRILFTNDGNHAVLTNYAGLIEYLDFDRCSGLFSNPINISNEFDNPYLFGVATSPDDSKLFVSTVLRDTSYVFQYDLNAPDIRASKDTIHVFTYPPSYYEAGEIRLAPDGKMYVNNQYQNGINSPFPYQDSMYNYMNMNLSVINDPNQAGAACNFQPYSFYLGGARAYWGLPNNPNYDLPAWHNSICDTINAVNTIQQKNPELNVFYHPDWKKLFVNASALKDGRYDLYITSIDEKQIYHSLSSALNGYLTTDIPADQFASGGYIVTLTNQSLKLSVKFVIP